MQQIEKELRLNQLKLIVIVATIIFAFMLIYTIYWLADYKDKYGFFQKGDAVVIEHQEIDGKTYDLLSYIVNDNEFRITTEYESKNDIGDSVTIYYDENYPLGVVYSLDNRRISLPIMSGIFGIVNVSLVVVYFLLRKTIKNGATKETQENIVQNDELETGDDVNDNIPTETKEEEKSIEKNNVVKKKSNTSNNKKSVATKNSKLTAIKSTKHNTK